MLKLQFKDRRQEPVWLVDKTFSIGRDASNSLMIADESVCQSHAEISNNNNQLSITNLSDNNTLWINGDAVLNPRILQAGDIIKLGQVELEVIDPHTGQQSPQQTSISSETLWKLKSNASWLEQEYISIQDTLIIGREQSCDLCLPLDHLSRQHVELSVKGGKLYIRDLESSNGTFLNGKRINESWASNGDKLKLDVVTFEIIGPDYDPNRTIVRQAPTEDASTQGKTTRQTDAKKGKTAKAETGKSKPAVKGGAKAPASPPVKKPLSANGKQEWIKNNTQQQVAPKPGNTKWLVFAAVVVVAIVAAFVI